MARLARDGSNAIVLSHYKGGARQERHFHTHGQVSFLLCGEMEECIGRRPFEVLHPSVCVKPAGTEHHDRWGRRGVLMLSLRLEDLEADVSALPVERWCPASADALRPLVRAAQTGAAFDLVSADLLACAVPDAPDKAVPSWLGRVREEAREAPHFSIAEAAASAGVHRVHLSRAFARHFGLPLSIYRQHVQVARAVEAAVREGDPLAAVADAAGFADQSHMTRAIRAATGVSPGRLRRLFN